MFTYFLAFVIQQKKITMEWFNWKKNQHLTHKYPQTAKDLQGHLKKGLKLYISKKSFETPYYCSLARDIYSDQVVKWCVNWLKCCKLPNYNMEVNLNEEEWTIFVTFTST